MNIDPPNSIRKLHTAVSQASGGRQRRPQPKGESHAPDEPDEVELKLSEEVETVPKHQRSKETSNASQDATAEPVLPNDDRLDVTI